MENIRGKQFEAVQKEGLELFKKKTKTTEILSQHTVL